MDTSAQRTTSARGYGQAHQQARARLLAALIPGTPCRRCGHPMYPWQKLDAGHPDNAPARTRQPPDALEHATCNRAAGGRLRQALARRTPRTSRIW